MTNKWKYQVEKKWTWSDTKNHVKRFGPNEGPTFRKIDGMEFVCVCEAPKRALKSIRDELQNCGCYVRIVEGKAGRYRKTDAVYARPKNLKDPLALRCIMANI